MRDNELPVNQGSVQYDNPADFDGPMNNAFDDNAPETQEAMCCIGNNAIRKMEIRELAKELLLRDNSMSAKNAFFTAEAFYAEGDRRWNS